MSTDLAGRRDRAERTSPFVEWAWSAPALGLLVIFSELNVAVLGPAGQGAARWLVTALVSAFPLLFLIRSTILPELLSAAPVRWLGLWAAWSVVALMWSVAGLAGSAPLIALGILTCCALPAWFVTVYGWDRFVDVVARAVVVLMCANLLMTLLGDPDVAWSGSRLVGAAWSPTHLGRIGAVAVLLGLVLLTRSPRRTALGVACLVSGPIAVLSSGTRTVVLAFAAVGLLALLRSGRRVPAAGMVLVATVAVAALAWMANDSRDLGTATGRTEIWAATWHRVADAPVVGLGTGSGETIYDEMARAGDLSWRAFTAHNALLHLQLTQGIIGVGLFLAACACYVTWSRRAPNTGRDCLMLLLLVNSATEALVEQASLALILFAAAVASAAVDGSGAGRAGP